MPFVPRHFGRRLRELLKQFPVVCVLGPRQCGKTTFARESLPSWRYLDLEKPSDLAKIEDDPEEALRRWPRQVIFDEAQRLPSLFPVLRAVVDESRHQRSRFILLGSASFGLIKGISESLAGRIGFLDMTPFHLNEVSRARDLWVRGGFPDAFLQKKTGARQDWYEGYLRTLIERDLGQMGVSVSSAQIRRLLTMLAHIHGGLLNASELGNSLGLSYHTVQRYIDILEQTFLVRRLKPFFANIGKREVKSPKIYLRDSGLLHHLLGIKDGEDLDGHPKRGASFEGFVIEQVAGILSLKAPAAELYFWKTSAGKEVDLLIRNGALLLPIEIKLHSAPQRSDLKGIITCLKEMKLKKGYVIRPEGERYSLGEGIEVITLKELLEQIDKSI